jgi:hypothetical protein
MKKYIVTIALFALTVIGLNVQAQTNHLGQHNKVSADSLITQTNEAPEFNKIDLTFGSAGTSYGGHNEVGIDVSVSIDPFQKLPELWVGVSQSLYWQPTFAASTDIDAAWNFNITDKICVLAGWSIGDIYGASDIDNLIRTGPEVIAQYYVSDDAYFFGAVNYDLVTKNSSSGWQTDSENNGWRFSAGIGLEF